MATTMSVFCLGKTVISTNGIFKWVSVANIALSLSSVLVSFTFRSQKHKPATRYQRHRHLCRAAALPSAISDCFGEPLILILSP